MDKDARELMLIRAGLSPQEAAVVVAIEHGESPANIAKRMGKSIQAICNARDRGYIKLKNL